MKQCHVSASRTFRTPKKETLQVLADLLRQLWVQWNGQLGSFWTILGSVFRGEWSINISGDGDFRIIEFH